MAGSPIRLGSVRGRRRSPDQRGGHGPRSGTRPWREDPPVLMARTHASTPARQFVPRARRGPVGTPLHVRARMESRFRDRGDAGRRLGEAFARYAGQADLVMLPRGGVPVGFEVAQRLRRVRRAEARCTGSRGARHGRHRLRRRPGAQRRRRRHATHPGGRHRRRRGARAAGARASRTRLSGGPARPRGARSHCRARRRRAGDRRHDARRRSARSSSS